MARGIKTGGRKKGTPNKISGTVKANVVAVFDQIGGVDGMVEWANENKTEFYRLYGKLMPTEVEGPGENGEFILKVTQDDKSVL